MPAEGAKDARDDVNSGSLPAQKACHITEKNLTLARITFVISGIALLVLDAIAAHGFVDSKMDHVLQPTGSACNPLAVDAPQSHCLLPFPSFHNLVPDRKSPTGYHVWLADNTVPARSGFDYNSYSTL